MSGKAHSHREPYPEIFMDYRQVIALQQRWGAPEGRGRSAWRSGSCRLPCARAAIRPAVIPQVRQAITRAEPNAALDAIMPMDSLVANSVARQRFYAVMLAAFAAVAALLARSAFTASSPISWSSAPARSACEWRSARVGDRCLRWCSAAD